MRWLALVVVMNAGCVSAIDPSGAPSPTPGDGGDPQSADSETTDETPTDDATAHCPATIADIKNGTVGVGASACLKGVLVTAVSDAGVFVTTPDADAYAGLFLGAPVGPSIAMGDTVNVGIAMVQTSAGELQLRAPTLVVTSSGDAASPAVVAASDLASSNDDDAAYEAMLVFVPTVTVVDASADGFTVSDDGGDHVISVGGFLSRSVLNVSSGGMFDSITGIWRATPSGYVLEPRGEFDLQPAF